MEREGHNKVAMFVGIELENSMAKGAPTLFVVGKEEISEIISSAKSNSTGHIYLCANKSFDPNEFDYYADAIKQILDEELCVTIDFPSQFIDDVQHKLKFALSNPRFIPMVNVEVPNLKSMPNLAIRIDDIDFNCTNPGVWVVNYNTINNTQCYTPWSSYTGDRVIKLKAD